MVQQFKSLQEMLQYRRSQKMKYIGSEGVMKWALDHKQTSDYLYSFVPRVFELFEKTERKEKIKAFKNICMYNADRKLDLINKGMEWRTNFKTPYTLIFCNTYFNRFFDSEFTIDIQALTEAGVKAKKSVDAINSWFYATAGIQVQLKLAIRDAINTKDGFLYVGMTMAPEKNQEFNSANGIAGEKDKVWEVTKCNGKAEHVPWEEIIYDIKVGFEDSPFVGRRKIESDESFNARWSHLIDINKDVREYINNPNNAKPLFAKDYSMFRKLKEYEDKLITGYTFGFTEYDLYKYNTDDIFQFGETYEHWTNTTFTLVRNGHVIVDMENPLGIDMHPYVHFEGPGIGLLLTGLQEIYDLVYNGYGDYLKRHFNPMFMSTGGQFIEGFEGGYLDWEPYKVIKNLGDGKLERIDLGDDIQNGFSMLASIWELGSQISQVNRYTQAGPAKGVERSKGATDYLVQITSEGLKPLAFNISIALNRASKIWTRLAKDHLPENFKVSILGKDGNEEFRKIKLSDLENEFIIRYSSEAIGDYNKQKDINNLNLFLQYHKVLGQDPSTGIYLFKQRELAERSAELFGFKNSVITDEEIKRILEQRAEAAEAARAQQLASMPTPGSMPTQDDSMIVE